MSPLFKHDTQPEDPHAVGSAKDVEDLMRKYDKESNTRIWEGTPAVIVRMVMVFFSLYCIWSTLFSVAALEKRLTAFLALLVIMGYLIYPASKHHVRHNYIPWYDYVIMVLGAACFLYYYFSYDSLVTVLTSFSRMSTLQVAIAIVGLLTLMELCRRCPIFKNQFLAIFPIVYYCITLVNKSLPFLTQFRIIFYVFLITSVAFYCPLWWVACWHICSSLWCASLCGFST